MSRSPTVRYKPSGPKRCAAKRPAAASRPASGLPGFGDEDIAQIGEGSAIETTTGQCQRDASLAVLRVRQMTS
jgi:hypothetical protein